MVSCIKASVANFGNQDRKNVPVGLSVDGRKMAEKRIDIAKGGSQGVEFQLPGLISGAHPVILEIDDPYLTRDNRFYMTIEARGKTPVLVVENPDARGTALARFFPGQGAECGCFISLRINRRFSAEPGLSREDS